MHWNVKLKELIDSSKLKFGLKVLKKNKKKSFDSKMYNNESGAKA